MTTNPTAPDGGEKLAAEWAGLYVTDCHIHLREGDTFMTDLLSGHRATLRGYRIEPMDIGPDPLEDAATEARHTLDALRRGHRADLRRSNVSTPPSRKARPMAEQEMLPVEQVADDIISSVEWQMSNCLPAKGEPSGLCETRRYRKAIIDAVTADRLAATKAADERVRGLEARAASAEVALTEAEAERDAAEDRVRALTEHLAEQITHAETRIQDGIEMGAAVWRIALEDIVRENRAALAEAGGRHG